MGGRTISLRVDGRQVGTMGCESGTQSFDVSAGRYAVNACDARGDCWGNRDISLGAGEEYRYQMFCRTASLTQKVR
jgi:hypothetical protein